MSRPTTTFITLFIALAVVAAAYSAGTSSSFRPGEGGSSSATLPPDGIDRPADPIRPKAVLASNALVPFEACDAFLEYVTSQAVELVGPYGLEDPFYSPRWGGNLALEDAVAVADGVSRASGQGIDYSGSNVQVLGVDEPDIVKTDGERIVVLSEGTLIVADVTGQQPEVIGRMQVGDLAVQNLFLSGDTVLLFGSAWSTVYPIIEADVEYAPVYNSPTVQLIEVDISDDPEIIRTMSIDGRFISARMVGDTVRLVLTSGPVGFDWSFPTGSGLRAERKAVAENREIIEGSTEDNWIPFYVVTDTNGDVTDEGLLFDCDRANQPVEFSGLDMLSVVTIDLGAGLDVVDATGVLATGDTVYASTDSLYVATQNWEVWQWAQTGTEDDRPEGVTTEIHKFDISRNDRTVYVAAGSVSGYLLNQFSMDEYEGLLRVASTSSPNWWGVGSDSESRVTVLGEDDGELVEIGMVDGLGKTEQIYSVRFMEDVAYVVTFRQTDPLYTIDLSNPERPEVVGELKIHGYSAYLHPIGDGLLMGIGQDATDSGRVQGTQVSIFDVSDISDPTRIDQFTLNKGSSSSVEFDHLAFLYWDQTGLAMVPVQQWWWDSKPDSAFFGAVGLRVDDDGYLEEVRRIAHPGGDDEGWDPRAQILRSIVIGDSVYTVSAKGIMRSDLDSLREEAWLSF
ncbi:MAG: beta-propeller domain-containing protein [Acidimicrobiia bacterium]